MAIREYEGNPEELNEPETTEEALALMTGRLHPRRDVTEYLTVLNNREVPMAASLATVAEILREANMPSLGLIRSLGIDPEQKYEMWVPTGVQKKKYIENGMLIEKIDHLFSKREVSAQEYVKHLIKTNRGLAQALCLGALSKHFDNYRVSKEGLGRRGGISIAQSMVTGKQESSMGGLLGRFRRAIGK